ncbi:MAG: transcriptional regulator [Actinomycetia bacterium]|jgi:transcriptional regulator with XRE-family HTH domain|nr:transcriptional regulator [Actinomycetes bacterium]
MSHAVTSESPANGSGADDSARRTELADFLRRRREAISPAEVGLHVGGRRRTPGLRREEVAQLAGVGVTWYTWLEQARAIRVSENVLEALTRALRLDSHERAHLFNLAGAPSTAAVVESDTLDPAVALLLHRFGSYPASVTNARYDILAYNPSYAALMGDIESLPFDQRNILWLMFTSARTRKLLVDWEHATRRCVAQFRASYADHMSEPAWRSMVKRLQDASPEFGAYWEEHHVAAAANVVKQFRHPELGLLRFNATNMWLSQRVGNRMIVLTPADEATESAYPRLAQMQPPPIATGAP